MFLILRSVNCFHSKKLDLVLTPSVKLKVNKTIGGDKMHFKRILLSVAAVLTMALLFVGCGNDSTVKEKSAAVRPEAQGSVETKNTAQQGVNGLKGKKILIAYFSHTNHTREFAEEIQKDVGGNLFAIEPVEMYPTGHDAVVAQAKNEVNSGYTPQLKQDIDTSQYDVIFIGTPIWWYTFAPPVRTFLASHDLSGKLIIPFSTHKGSGLSGIDSKISELQPNAKILKGHAIWDDQAKSKSAEIKEWLTGLTL